MALTITNDPVNFGGLGMTGGRRYRFSTIDFDTSYPVGGEPIVKADFDFPGAISGFMLVSVTDGADLCTGIVYDAENSKLMVIDADGSDTADTTNLAGLSVVLLAIGY